MYSDPAIMIIVVIVLLLIFGFIMFHLFYKKDSSFDEKPVPLPLQDTMRYTEPISNVDELGASAPQYDAELEEYDDKMLKNEWTDDFSAFQQQTIYMGNLDDREPYKTKDKNLAVILKNEAANITFIIFTKSADLTINIYNNENVPIFNIRRDGRSLITNGLTKTNVLYTHTKVLARVSLVNNRLYINGKFIAEYNIQPIKTITLESEDRCSKSLFITDQLIFL